jgi:hypothetical protein
MKAAIKRRPQPTIKKPLWLTVAVEPPPVPTPPDGTRGICGTVGVPPDVIVVGGAAPTGVWGGSFACGGAASGGAACVRLVLRAGAGGLVLADGVEPVVGVGLVDGVALAEGVALGTITAAVITLDTLAEQVNSVPPALPEPLHWLMVTGIAAVTVDGEPTEHTAVEPPPITDWLHCVIVAPDVVAGNGLHTRGPRPPKLPPPVADPTHWLTVAAVSAWAPGVSALTLLMT